MAIFWVLGAFALAQFAFVNGKKQGRRDAEFFEFPRQQEIGYQKALEALEKRIRGEITEEEFRNPRLDMLQPRLGDWET